MSGIYILIAMKIFGGGGGICPFCHPVAHGLTLSSTQTSHLQAADMALSFCIQTCFLLEICSKKLQLWLLNPQINNKKVNFTEKLMS